MCQLLSLRQHAETLPVSSPRKAIVRTSFQTWELGDGYHVDIRTHAMGLSLLGWGVEPGRSKQVV